MFSSAKTLSRENRVKKSKDKGIQGEERNISYYSSKDNFKVETGSPYDFAKYIPIGMSVDKIQNWVQSGSTIYYLTSRRKENEIISIKNILKQYYFPQYENLYYRKEGEDYEDVVTKILPDILVEDDCESIGGKKEMTHTNLESSVKDRIQSLVVKEFEGIDHLPDKLQNIHTFKIDN